MIQAIFFDLDETLVDRTKTFQAYLGLQYRELIKPLGVEEGLYYDAVHRWDDNGYRDKLDTFRHVIQDLALNLTADSLLAHFKENYGFDAELFDGVESTLVNLQERFRLALITNGRTQGQGRKLQKTGISSYFEQILISQSVGLKKPEPAIYLLACERMRVSPEQVLFVGDHPRNDVATPKQLGMKAVWVENSVYQAPKLHDGIIQSVVDLPALI